MPGRRAEWRAPSPQRSEPEASEAVSHLRCDVRRALHARPEHGDGDMDNVYSRRIPRFIPDVLN